MTTTAPRQPAAKATTTASNLLLAAALSGLVGGASVLGCSSDDKPAADSSGNAGAGGGHDHDHGKPDAGGGGGGSEEVYNRHFMDAGSMDMDGFRALCAERNGLVYTNAACAGSAACKGLSLHSGLIWEHSCRGQNSTCAGAGCLDMPEDEGVSGKELYEQGACAGCHADWSQVTNWDDPEDEVNYGKYAVFYDPKLMTEAQAMKRFEDSSSARFEAIIAMGTQGFNSDFTPHSNMPAYYKEYSLAEIRRVAEHIKDNTEAFPSPFEVFGEPPLEEAAPDGGSPDGG